MSDLKEGRLSMVDAQAFAPAQPRPLAGKVVYRNKLIELIQYEPKSETVHRVPLLVCAVDQQILPPRPAAEEQHGAPPGRTGLHCVHGVLAEPGHFDGRHTIEDYVDLGPLAASDVVREITGSPTVNVVGYCIAGTLLAMTLAWLAAKGDETLRRGDAHGVNAGLLQGRRYGRIPR